MPKMEAASITQKISLSQIIDTGNIRELKKYQPNTQGEYPAEIIELAQSIKQIGQIQPVVVKPAGEENGAKQYELVAGFRRRAAFQYLCSIGEDFQQIEANIKTGDKLIIQLVENIQREDLTAPEREKAIYELAESGLKQNEIAAALSKSKSFVSINISAWKMRQTAAKNNIDLSGVETSTLSELLSVRDNKLVYVLRELSRRGGTRSVANFLAESYKKGEKPTATPPIETPAVFTPPVSSATSEPDNSNDELDPNLTMSDEEYSPIESTPPHRPPLVSKPEQIEADHRIIDVNVILSVILDFIKSADGERQEAARDILALIHKELDK